MTPPRAPLGSIVEESKGGREGADCRHTARAALGPRPVDLRELLEAIWRAPGRVGGRPGGARKANCEWNGHARANRSDSRSAIAMTYICSAQVHNI